MLDMVSDGGLLLEVFAGKDLLERGAKKLSDLAQGQFAGYLYLDDAESGTRRIYEPLRDGSGDYLVLRNKFSIP